MKFNETDLSHTRVLKNVDEFLEGKKATKNTRDSTFTGSTSFDTATQDDEYSWLFIYKAHT
jgi:hypothetical protein